MRFAGEARIRSFGVRSRVTMGANARVTKSELSGSDTSKQHAELELKDLSDF